MVEALVTAVAMMLIIYSGYWFVNVAWNKRLQESQDDEETLKFAAEVATEEAEIKGE